MTTYRKITRFLIVDLDGECRIRTRRPDPMGPSEVFYKLVLNIPKRTAEVGTVDLTLPPPPDHALPEVELNEAYRNPLQDRIDQLEELLSLSGVGLPDQP